MHIAYFITPHGFGHATRASAVMVALQEIDPTVQFEIFTQVPRWIFEDSLVRDFRYHDVSTDIGVVQATSLREDLPATVRRLDAFYPCDAAVVTDLASQLRRTSCTLVLCDIAPLGIVAARAAHVPSVLIENFTWDWIYQGYIQEEPRLARHMTYLQDLFAAADYHVQTEPVCCPCPVDLRALPVSRKPRRAPQQIRAQLGIPASAQAVLITMGGVTEPYTFLSQLQQYRDIFFVVLGGDVNAVARQPNVMLFPPGVAVFTPDLMHACDAVVGKVGYSILAEAYHAGVAFGYVMRQHFREAPVLASYITAHMPGIAITEPEFYSGAWLACLPDLLALPRQPQRAMLGAEQIAHFVYGLPDTTRQTPA